MATSPPPAANLPTAPILDALPPLASPDYPIALARRLASVSTVARLNNIPFLWLVEVIVITSPNHDDFSTARSRPSRNTDS